jgi:hypothetical protein
MRTLGLFMTASALALASVTTNAQSEKKVYYLSLGPTASMGISSVTGLYGSNRLHPSGALGIGFVYSKKEHWGFGGGLNMSQEGFENRRTINNTTYTSTVSPFYLRVPLSVNYFFRKYGDAIRPKIYLGPSFGFKVGERDDMAAMPGMEYTSHSSDLFNGFDVGIQGGAGVNVRLAPRLWLNMDLGGYQGVVDVTDIPSSSATNTNEDLRVNIGLMFGL